MLQRIVTVAVDVSSPTITRFCDELERLSLPVSQRDLDALVGGAVQPEVRGALSALLKAWRQDAPDLTPQAFAWALRAANATDDHHRARQSLEIVWSGPESDTTTYRRTDQALLELIQEAKTSILLATFAAYKVPKIAAALVKAAGRGVKVTLILESAEESEGKLTCSAIKGLGAELAKAAEVYVWPLEKRGVDSHGQHGALHVKCAVVDDNAALVSSANLTEYAMNLNMELGLLVTGGDVPRTLAQHLRSLVRVKTLVPISIS